MFTHRRPLVLLFLIVLTFAAAATPVSAGFGSRSGTGLLPTGSASLSVLVLKGFYDVGPAPLEGALVQVLSADTGELVAAGLTNARGMIDFKLNPGNYSLVIEGKGKSPNFTKWLTLDANQDYSMAVTLLPLQ